MGFKILVQPSGQRFEAADGQTVLDAALQAGVVLPYSCRNGTCSTCRGRVLDGVFDAGSAPARILDAADRADGMTLLCQARPQSDLVIEAQVVQLDRDIEVRQMPTRIVSIDALAADVVQVTLQLPTTQPFRFQPGQYLTFLLPDGQRRNYSMACATVRAHRVVLHVRHTPGGAFTDRLFGGGAAPIKPRDILRIEGPLGSFFVRHDDPRPLVFLASGTGFAPIGAIIDDLVARADARPAILYWGGRRPTDLYQFERARQWASQHADFRFVPVVSDARPEDAWTGRAGWVHRAVMVDFPDLSAHCVYACGSPLMVEAARQDFTRHCGLPSDAFYADAFTTEADRVAAGSLLESKT